jgi:phage major head subunit gpT-like protein
MIINQGNLATLFTGYKAAFQNGFAAHTPTYQRVATVVPSSTRTEKYAWLGQAPRIREWLGDRVLNNIAAHDYSIANKSFESTIAVDRDDIEDDSYGVYTPLMSELGRSIAVFPDELVYGIMSRGFTDLCYDKLPMFSANHPVVNAKGKDVSVSNMQDGANAPWFLLDTSRSLKPFIFQNRRKFDFIAKTDPKTSDDVFNTKQFVYGTDGRCNVGFGFWQMAFGSKAALTKENFRAARTAMMNMTGDNGRPLGLTPNLLVVGTANSDAARDIILAERLPNGATNTDRNLVEIFQTPWLA